MTDPKAHKRYLDYRERHAYFGKAHPLLTMPEYFALETEIAPLEAKGEDARDDEEEARFAELAKLLYKD